MVATALIMETTSPEEGEDELGDVLAEDHNDVTLLPHILCFTIYINIIWDNGRKKIQVGSVFYKSVFSVQMRSHVINFH